MEDNFYLRITNSFSYPIELILEPLGDVFSMAPAETFEIEFQSRGERNQSSPEIAWSEHVVTVYSGKKGLFVVRVNGKELGDKQRKKGEFFSSEKTPPQGNNGITSRY